MSKSAYARPVTVEFNMDSTKILSPLYFGDNLEHTRGCISGGLSAQMLKNRKFAALPSHDGCAQFWERIGSRTYFALKEPYTCHGEGYKMVRSHERYCQRITSYHPEPAGIRQRGLWVQSGKNYLFTMAAKVFAPLDVTLRLTTSETSVLFETTLHLEQTDFSTVQVPLSPKESAAGAALEIFFREPGTLSIGSVSLLPADHFLGMRKDIIEKMKELGIRLLRWPGGHFSGEYHW